MRPRPIDVDVELEVVVEKKEAGRRADEWEEPVAPLVPLHSTPTAAIVVPAVRARCGQ